MKRVEFLISQGLVWVKKFQKYKIILFNFVKNKIKWERLKEWVMLLKR